MPRFRATWRCGTPSATSRRIRAQSSTEITHPICLGGPVFDRRYGLVFKRRRHVDRQHVCAGQPHSANDDHRWPLSVPRFPWYY
jgi:hypothetical protein